MLGSQTHLGQRRRMPNLLLTADSHFAHANVIEYTGRPFASVNEMDEAMIAAWNSVVGPDDVVYHLGDFCLGGLIEARWRLSRLNGIIHILGYPWHHDKRWLPKPDSPFPLYSAIGFRVVIEPPMVVLELEQYQLNGRPMPLVLCHYPLAPSWDRAHYGSWHAFGHCHGRYNPSGLCLDVGVDNAYKLLGAYRPFRLEEFAEIMFAREGKRVG